jgi:hypothetical protein
MILLLRFFNFCQSLYLRLSFKSITILKIVRMRLFNADLNIGIKSLITAIGQSEVVNIYVEKFQS